MKVRLLHSLTMLIVGCGSTWYGQDYDGDGYSPAAGDCWDKEPGPEGTDLSAVDINPAAYEYCDGVDNNCDELVDEGAFAIGVEANASSGQCSDGYGGVHTGEFTWGVDSGCDARWYIACNDPAATISAVQGSFTNDGCRFAQESNPTWPLEADTDGDGVAEVVATCGWLEVE